VPFFSNSGCLSHTRPPPPLLLPTIQQQNTPQHLPFLSIGSTLQEMIYNGEKVSKNITALSAVQWVAACDGAFTDGVALDAPSLARELTRWAK
jgi:hypothetical protein